MQSKRKTFKLTKIMVFGTFDGVHKGHIDFFKQARAIARNPFLIVSIARDKNVKKIKGSNPYFSEKKRMSLVSEFKLVDKVVLGGVGKYLPHILKEKPDIIALGYDQKVYVDKLENDLKKLNFKIMIVRLKPYKEHIYKNYLLHAKNRSASSKKK